ncbi:mitochondrial protein Pet127-domain-containing protein [Podospora aff. communis PSN243]|uniref:Mitochondrial protein Pet127-domain-containing protein n=1 Tax=Podospora aff. communis PSN243 TaxID=3040156 RepID=A0AAV9GJU2_9PEZI|nr:mitochondrial protein Pet127-domain-containing protein [Podospora aff. communis PSN243]
MLRIGNRVRRSVTQVIIRTSCRRNQIISRAALPTPSVRAALSPACQHQLSTTHGLADEPKPGDTNPDARTSETSIQNEGENGGSGAAKSGDAAADSHGICDLLGRAMDVRENSESTANAITVSVSPDGSPAENLAPEVEGELKLAKKKKGKKKAPTSTADPEPKSELHSTAKAKKKKAKTAKETKTKAEAPKAVKAKAKRARHKAKKQVHKNGTPASIAETEPKPEPDVDGKLPDSTVKTRKKKAKKDTPTSPAEPTEPGVDSEPPTLITKDKKKNKKKEKQAPTSTADPEPKSERKSEAKPKKVKVREVPTDSKSHLGLLPRTVKIRKITLDGPQDDGLRDRYLESLRALEPDAANASLTESTAPKKKKRRARLGDVVPEESGVLSFNPGELEAASVQPLEKRAEVPGLKYGLERALFNPGVYHLQDPYSKVFNFDPYLTQIMPAEEFDFDALRNYVTSSKDTTLLDLTIKHGKKYTGSTSSMTSTLAHFHHLLSHFRPLNFEMLSHGFMSTVATSCRFTRFNRGPVGTFLHWKDGAYAIDADKEFDSETILSQLGRSMEKLLTLEKNDYEKYRKSNTEKPENGAAADEAFQYTTMGDFLMRSQLDARDPRLPGNGTFDLKTRAVVTIRMNMQNYRLGTGYEIRGRFGEWESFEREYYDMIRAAFLKYSLQVRMGRMNGIFVAFHNTERIFGFQYIPLSEMDCAIHGSPVPCLGDREYKASIHLLNAVLDKVTARFPQRTLRLSFEARDATTPFLYVFARPVTDREVARVQEDAQDRAEKIARKMEAKAVTNKQVAAMPKTPQWPVSRPHHVNVAALSKHRLWRAIVFCLTRRAEITTSFEQGEEDWKSSFTDRLTGDLCKSRRFGGFSICESSPRAALAKALMGPLGPHREAGTAKVVEYVTDALGSTAAPRFSVKLPILLSELERRIWVSSTGQDGIPDPGRDEHVDDPWLQEVEKALETVKQSIEALAATDSDAPTADTDAPTTNTDAPTANTDAPTADTGAPTAVAIEMPATAPVKDDEDSELYGLIVSIKNKVNGEYVERPNDLRPKDVWEIEYSIKEMPTTFAQYHYELLRKRRVDMFQSREAKETGRKWDGEFRDILMRYSQKGRSYREKMMQKAMKRPVHVLGIRKALAPVSVFKPRHPTSWYKSWRGPLRPRTFTKVKRREATAEWKATKGSGATDGSEATSEPALTKEQPELINKRPEATKRTKLTKRAKLTKRVPRRPLLHLKMFLEEGEGNESHDGQHAALGHFPLPEPTKKGRRLAGPARRQAKKRKGQNGATALRNGDAAEGQETRGIIIMVKDGEVVQDLHGDGSS